MRDQHEVFCIRFCPVDHHHDRDAVVGATPLYPGLWHGRQLFMAFELVPQALATLVKPFGKPLLPINPVTPKGQAAMGRHIDGRTLACLVVVMLGMITGLVRAGYERFGGHPLEMAMLLVWSLYFMSIITIAGLMCCEPWYRRRAERFDLAAEPASLWVRGQAIPVRILNMSVTGARVRTLHPLVLPVDQPLYLQKQHVPAPLPCTLVYRSDTELAVDFFPLTNPAVRRPCASPLHQPCGQGNQQATFACWPVVKRSQPTPDSLAVVHRHGVAYPPPAGGDHGRILISPRGRGACGNHCFAACVFLRDAHIEAMAPWLQRAELSCAMHRAADLVQNVTPGWGAGDALGYTASIEFFG